MKFQIQLDDDVAEIYQSYAAARPGQTVEQVLAIQLQRYVHADPRLRILLILPEERARLEELTSRMPITTVSDLVSRVALLAELSIGRIRFRWTPTQFRQLKERAAHWGISVQEYAERIVRQIEEQFFDMTPQPRKAGPPEDIRIKEPPQAPAPPVPPAVVAAATAGQLLQVAQALEVHEPASLAAEEKVAPPVAPTPVTRTLRQPPAGVRRS